MPPPIGELTAALDEAVPAISKEVSPAVQRVHDMFNAVWDPKSVDNTTALAVLHDHFLENPDKAKVQGSLTVKKDLLGKINKTGDDYMAASDNRLKIETRRNDHRETNPYDPSKDWKEQYPETANPRPDTSLFRDRGERKKDDPWGNLRYWQNKGIRAEALGSATDDASKNGGAPSDAWKNLMEDPAFPNIAALIGSGAVAGVALASKKAQAEQPVPKGGLGLKAAQAPQVNWEGVTSHILQSDADAKRAASNMSEMGVDPSPDIFTHEAAIKDFLSQHPTSDALGKFESTYVDPVIKSAQDKIGKPMLDGSVTRQRKLFKDQGKSDEDAKGGEYLNRFSGSLLAGKDQAEEFANSPEGLKGLGSLESSLGVTGAAAATFAGKTLGEFPLFIIGGPGTGLTKAVTTGALVGAASPEMSIEDGMMVGAAMHGAIRGVSVLGDMFRDMRSLLKAPAVPSAEAWAKVGSKQKYVESSVPALPEGKLIGVVTQDGIDNLGSQLAKHPPTPVEPAGPKTLFLPRSTAKKMPSFIIGTFDEAGNPIVKIQYFDPSVEAGYTVESKPLTLDLANKLASAHKLGTPEASVVSWLDVPPAGINADANPEAFEALMGKNVAPQVQRRPLTADDWESMVDASNKDILGIRTKPDGAEIRIYKGVPVVQPVYAEDLLPEDISPIERTRSERGPTLPMANAGDPTIFKGEGTPTKVTRFGEQTRPAFGGGRPGDTQIQGRIPDNATMDATVSDAMKLGLRPSMGGGAGPLPPPLPSKLPKSLQGEARASAIKVKGPLLPEVPTLPQGQPSEANVDPEALATVQGVMRNLANLQSAGDGLGDKALALIVGRHLRGPTDLATLVTSIKASGQLMKSGDDVKAAFQRQLGTPLLSKMDRWLNDYGLGKITLDQFTAEFPSVSDQAKQFCKSIFDEKQARDARLIDMGLVPDDLGHAREHGIVDLYMNQNYFAHKFPRGVWFKNKLSAPQMEKTLERGVTRILRDQKSQTATESDIAIEIQNMLNSDNPMESFKGSPISKPYQALMEKNRELPEEIQDLLGKNRSGIIAFANTIGMGRSIEARANIMDEVVRGGFASEHSDTATGMVYRLPDHPSMYGARNLYTSQAIMESLQGAPKMENTVLRILHLLQSISKGFQIVEGGLGPHINSFVANLISGTLSGGLDPLNPGRSGVHLWRAANAMFNYRSDPTGNTGLGFHVLDAKRMGSDYFGFGHEEINNPAALKFNADLRKAFPDGPAPSYYEGTKRLLQLGLHKYQRGTAWLGSGLDWVDRTMRMQSYMSLNDKFLADLAKNGNDSILVKEGLLPEGNHNEPASDVRAMLWNMKATTDLNSPMRLVREAAAKLATRRVNQSFMNPTFVGTGVDTLRKYGAGIVTPYATATFEDFRIMGSIPKRLIDEPDLRYRLATVLGLLGGVVGVAKSRCNVSDQEIQDAYDARSDSQKTYRPDITQMALPFHDDKGRVMLWNMTPYNGILRLLVGDPSDPMLNKIATNLIMTPIEGGLAERPMRGLFESAGIVSPQRQMPVQMDKTGAMAVIQRLAKSGSFPGMYQKGLEAARRTDLGDGQTLGPMLEQSVPPLGELIGRPKPYEELLTPGEGALKALGVSNLEPVQPGGASSDRQTMETNMERGQLKKDQRRIFKGTGTDRQKDEGTEKVQKKRDRLFNK